MNQFQETQPKLKTDDGWFVQVYGSNRRLLCVLEPSHGWMFFAGCCMGCLVSVIWFNAARYSPPIEPTSPAEAPILQLD